MKKPKWLAHSIAKHNGYYSKSGEKLKTKRLSAEQVLEWNNDIVLPSIAIERVKLTVVPEEANLGQKEGMFQRIKNKLLGTH
jgi:hypothetical protein